MDASPRHNSKVELIECELAAGGTQQVIHVPHDRPLALIFVPRFGGEGLFGLAQTRVEELETAVLTGEGSFLSVRNAAPDKPLRQAPSPRSRRDLAPSSPRPRRDL
ncbi:MAG: hypothetical protein ACPIOQ_22860, partial [Promethearchaeia archaeon]